MPIQVFGAGAVQTAYVSFIALDLGPNSITLVWPTSYVDVPYIKNGIYYNVLAASMTVSTLVSNAHTITLPDARQSSVGANFIITNIGAASFQLLKADGSELIEISETDANSYWVQLTDNTTEAGGWQFVQFGAGTSNADASVLAGNGLTPLSGTLNTNVPVEKKTANYTVDLSDRAKLIVWKGGTGTLTLPLIAQVLSGFYLSFNNDGTGLLTLSADVNIDSSGNTLTLTSGQSLTLISDGMSWWSLGFGQNKFSNLFFDGSASTPSISFIADDSTGFFYATTPLIGVSVDGTKVADFQETGLTLTTPLSITSGGTGQTTRSSALDALMPPASTGSIIYRNASMWTVLEAGTSSQVLKGGANPTWGDENTPSPNALGQMLYSADGISWTVLDAGEEGEVLKCVSGIPRWSAP